MKELGVDTSRIGDRSTQAAFFNKAMGRAFKVKLNKITIEKVPSAETVQEMESPVKPESDRTNQTDLQQNHSVLPTVEQ